MTQKSTGSTDAAQASPGPSSGPGPQSGPSSPTPAASAGSAPTGGSSSAGGPPAPASGPAGGGPAGGGPTSEGIPSSAPAGGAGGLSQPAPAVPDGAPGLPPQISGAAGSASGGGAGSAVDAGALTGGGQAGAASSADTAAKAAGGNAVASGTSAASSSGASSAAMGQAGGALGAANVAGDVQKAAKDPNVGNTLRAAGNFDPNTKAASVAYDATADGLKKAKEVALTDAPKVGAGGTSELPEGSDTDGTVGKGDGSTKMVAAGGAAGATMSPIAFLMMLVQWLKSFFMAMMQMIIGWLMALLAMVINVVMTVAGVFMGVGAAVAGFVGGTISAVTGAFASFGAFAAGLTAVAVGVTSMMSNETARRDAPMPTCAPAVEQLQDALAVSDAVADVQTQTNAKRVYAIFAGMGMSDTNVAGILGNWTAESGVDPTGVETIFDERFHVGPKKQAAQDVEFLIDKYNPEYGARFPAIVQSGIGLGQWTNSRNVMLQDYAKKINKPWSEIDTQLGFMVSDDDSPRVSYIKQMISTEAPSVESATTDFMSKWEGLSDGSTSHRIEAANKWYAQMGDWEADTALADSILAQSGTSVGGANDAALANSLQDCLSADQGGVSDNSSLALAALSYAYPTTAEGVGNDGTPLYRELLEHIFPGDPYYQSCDRGVATAVRWSGTDDTFPPGNVGAQLAYLTKSPKWAEVSFAGDESKLQPGDVLIRWDGAGAGVQHIVLYVGNELVKQVFPSDGVPNGVTVSASFGERSPGVGAWYEGGSGLQTYRAFRSTGPEANSQYVNYKPKASGAVPAS